jgi:hypothetical protein
MANSGEEIAVMDPSIYFAFATELLKAFNMAQANKPPEQIRSEAIIAWGIAKPILRVILPPEIKKAIEDGGIKL